MLFNLVLLLFSQYQLVLHQILLQPYTLSLQPQTKMVLQSVQLFLVKLLLLLLLLLVVLEVEVEVKLSPQQLLQRRQLNQSHLVQIHYQLLVQMLHQQVQDLMVRQQLHQGFQFKKQILVMPSVVKMVFSFHSFLFSYLK